MKVYKTTWSGPDGCYLNWAGSKVMVAHAVKRRLDDDPELSLIRIEAVDVPQMRKALIHWLNHNVNMENG